MNSIRDEHDPYLAYYFANAPIIRLQEDANLFNVFVG